MNSLCKKAISVLFLSALGACQKQAAEVGEAKSYQYYLEHSDETKSVADKCYDFAKNELSTFSPDKRVAWEQTPTGINCSNANRARTILVLAEQQREMADAAKRLGK